MEISGGEHIMWSLQLLGKYLTSATLGEIIVDIEHLKPICFIHRTDENRYGELLQDLKKGKYKGRYEYYKYVAGSYELLTCTSCQIGP